MSQGERREGASMGGARVSLWGGEEAKDWVSGFEIRVLLWPNDNE